MLAPGSRCAVRNYAIRSPWLDRRDLEQEAHLAALEAARGWRPDGGSTPEQREAWVVGIALLQFVASQRSPVHVPASRGAEGSPERAAWEAAAGARRDRLDRSCGQSAHDEDSASMALDNPEVARVSAEQREPLEYRLDRERAMAEIRRILAEQTEAARLVLLAEEKSAEVARRMGVSIAEVYADTKRAMQALRLAFGVEVEAI